jgi:putative methyltransferase (TIGR04325 family)
MTVAGKIRSKIKELFPPSLKTFSSYSDALAASGSGYEDNELVDVIVLKTKQNIGLLKRNLFFTQSTLSSLTGILYLSGRFSTINVIDLGGSTGLQYHMLRPLINEKIHINWTVVESKTLAEKCRSVFSTGELQFSDNLEEAFKNSGELHLVLCSGVIQ